MALGSFSTNNVLPVKNDQMQQGIIAKILYPVFILPLHSKSGASVAARQTHSSNWLVHTIKTTTQQPQYMKPDEKSISQTKTFLLKKQLMIAGGQALCI